MSSFTRSSIPGGQTTQVGRAQALAFAPSRIRQRWLLWAIASFMFLAIYWCSVTELDELVRAKGRVMPSGQLQVVQNFEGGMVEQIRISEGDVVEAGQVLLKLDDTQFLSELTDGRQKLSALNIQAERLRAEAAQQAQFNLADDYHRLLPSIAEQEERVFVSRMASQRHALATIEQRIQQTEQDLARTEAELAQRRQELALARKELAIVAPLKREGVVSEIELIQAEKQVSRLAGQVTSSEFALPELIGRIRELQYQKQEMAANNAQEAQQALSSVLVEMAELEQSLTRLQDRFSRTEVTSPVKGTVKQVFVNTVGGVVRPGMDLVSIVPMEDRLLVEVQLKPSDIARVFPEQEALVKFTAYDFALYGGIKGRVAHISADSIIGNESQSYYLLRIVTEQNFLESGQRQLPIISGMLVDVDILAGKRTVMSYLMKPILKASQVALTE